MYTVRGYTCSLSKLENKGENVPSQKNWWLRKVSQNIITTCNILTESGKMKYPIYLLRKNMKTMHQESITMQPGGMAQSPKIQNSLKSVFIHYEANPKHIHGYNSSWRNV